MKIAVIGRNEILHDTAITLAQGGHEVELVVTAKEAPEYLVDAEDFRALATTFSAEFIRTARIGEAVDRIRALGPIDVGVSMNYPGLVPQAAIDCFRLGVLNAHPGDLPRYRGNACHAWAILNAEEKAGLCVHRMVGGGLDSGDIVARDYHPIELSTSVGALWDWMRARVPTLFAEALDRLDKDADYILEAQSTDPANALRCYPRRPEDGRILWNARAIDIVRLVNASNRPYAGAFCYYETRKLVVRGVCLVEDGERFLAVPGQVTAISDGSIEVAAGEGKVAIDEVEVDGETLSPDRLLKSLRSRLT